MEIINRINKRDNFIVTPLNDEFDTVTLRGKNSKDGTGDLVIHRNRDDKSKFDIKIIINPGQIPEFDKINITQSFMEKVGHELRIHGNLYASLVNKPISMFITPYAYTVMEASDMDSLYLFYLATTSAIRMMNIKDTMVPDSGLLH